MKCPECNFENPADTRFCGNCAAPLQPSKKISVPATKTLSTSKKELTTGSTFAGRYQVIEELGKGGMGRVYKVLDKDINEKVALKLLNPEVASDEETVERFKNELKLARKISHRNVCRMYDLTKGEGAHYITMEYVSGEDLKSFIARSGQLTVGKAISVARQVCEGLAEAHRLGVVHRDLKPQNIMIDKEGNALIMDFGIARIVKTKGITGVGVMIGTPEYMSPEQVEAKDVDQRSDIYSLGVILYEMLTGKVPLEAETPLAVAMKHKTETPKDPKELNSQIPEGLDRIILKCLEKDKEKRYKSAGEVRSELEKIEMGLPVTERLVPKMKPSTSKEITVTFNLKKLVIPVSIAAAVVIAAVLIWQFLPHQEAVPIPSDKPSLAIMYFKNNTGDQSLDHWRTALSDLLIADLTQSKYIRILSGDMLFAILRQLDLLEAKTYSREELKKVASRAGANHILLGDFSRAGENFRINIVIQKAESGEPLGSESVDGKGEENLISMVDDLTKKIKINLKLTKEEIAADIDKELREITTSSTKAYQYYNQGRNLHHKGEYRESIQIMEKALGLDPGFAMAYRSMAMSYNNLLMFSESKKYLQKAFELKDRLSDRERYLIEGEFFRNKEKTYPKAIEAYTKLLKLYPDDTIAGTNLGILYADLEDWDKSIEQYQVLIQNRDKSFFPYSNQSEAYRAKGMYDKAKEVLELYINNFGEHSSIRQELALNYFLQGNYEDALVEAKKALSFDPDDIMSIIYEGIISHCSGDYADAEKKYLEVLNTKELGYHLYARTVNGTLNLFKGKMKEGRTQFEQGIELAGRLGDNWWKAVFYTMLAYNYLRSGKPEEALKESDLAWNVSQEVTDELRWQRRSLFFKGLAYVGMKSLSAAYKTADELKRLCDEGINKKEIRLYYHLLGMIELEKKNYSRAIEYFQRATSFLPYQNGIGPFTNDHALFAEPLALAYYQAGDKEIAQKEYESIASMTLGKLYQGDVYARSLYMLARICEEQGLRERAIEHYQKFLELWKNADPGLPEVEEAKKRLSGLNKNIS